MCVFGPNNFPFAFNSIAGGDFAAAIAAGNPVIAKANTSHPGTTRLLAEEAHSAAQQAGLPPGTVQLIYRTSHADGERLVADPRIGATGYTGSRVGRPQAEGRRRRAGKPIYLELSSINPVVILPGALRERADKIADEFTGSCLMGTGQFCTNPGLVLLLAGPATEKFIDDARRAVQGGARSARCSRRGVASSLAESVDRLRSAGARSARRRHAGRRPRPQLRQHAAARVRRAVPRQRRGPADRGLRQRLAARRRRRRRTSSAACSSTSKATSPAASTPTRPAATTRCTNRLAPHLRQNVGRLLNDKMPTGVAVSPAMNHGGPYPATGHPGFTAVGIPASLRRFAMLQCYDNVRPNRLPPALADKNPTGKMWRSIDGQWTQRDV